MGEATGGTYDHHVGVGVLGNLSDLGGCFSIPHDQIEVARPGGGLCLKLIE
jgi:hypothetical protein